MDRVPGWGQGGLLVIEHRAEIAHVCACRDKR
jgi:hypothetical protein